MLQDIIMVGDMPVKIYSLNTVIVGTGAAGFNAADRLYAFGQKDIAIITEGLNMGTSRNTGSDKQTYYKLTLSGDTQDSVHEMAKTLYDGGSMDGDIAMVEAALSARAFYHLVEIGVPFPHNRYGEYIGYKTDHDPRQRATSVGPLTSKMMTEKLEEQVRIKGIKIFDGCQVIGILTDEDKAIGLVCLNLKELDNPDERYIVFNCTNIVYATGGPAGMYATSVYPESQTGASGIAFEAGVIGKNLTESQYGIASTKFRWNLSGTYQQVLPRYVSTDAAGEDEREFLEEYFNDAGTMLDAIFLKGYQWPFDPRKVDDFGSSLIDILVYNEMMVKGRRVFMDFMQNPSWGSVNDQLDFTILGDESYDYLKNSRALFGKPIERLAHMNQPAIDLYANHGIDLSSEYLEIAVCAQHNNGGLKGDLWWESNISHLFPVGEVNGSHGIYRPGGSALNSGQVASTRAAQFIAARYNESPIESDVFINAAYDNILERIDISKGFLDGMGDIDNVAGQHLEIGLRMSRAGAHIRSIDTAKQALDEAEIQLSSITDDTLLTSVYGLPIAWKSRDMLITQIVYLSAIIDYIESGGLSRGSYLTYDPDGMLPLDTLPEDFRFSLDDGKRREYIQEVLYKDGKCSFDWRARNPIPSEDDWFENVWNAYMRDEIIM